MKPPLLDSTKSIAPALPHPRPITSVVHASIGYVHTGLNAFADEEPFLIRRIKYRLQLIESLEAHHGGTFYGLATSGSELAGDDALMGHLQTSHLVAHCLSVSLDALRTSRFVLQDPKVDGGLRIPMIGHYAILRTAVEAAALAVWLMRPDDRTARLTRSLQARWDDIIHDDQMVHVLTGPLEGDSKQETSTKQHQRRENALRVRRLKNDLRQFAKAAQIPEEDFNRGLAGFGPDHRGRFDATGGQEHACAWGLAFREWPYPPVCVSQSSCLKGRDPNGR